MQNSASLPMSSTPKKEEKKDTKKDCTKAKTGQPRSLPRKQLGQKRQTLAEKARQVHPRKRATKRSKSLQKAFDQLSDISRRQAAHRKAQHGKLANEITPKRKPYQNRKTQYKAFQRLFGSSVGLRAPGMFIENTTSQSRKCWWQGRGHQHLPHKTLSSLPLW